MEAFRLLQKKYILFIFGLVRYSENVRIRPKKFDVKQEVLFKTNVIFFWLEMMDKLSEMSFGSISIVYTKYI